MTRREIYNELLKDECWITKRNAIFARDKHTCQDCGRNDIRLNVHHKYYDPDCDPWKYPSDALITLCEECHIEWDTMRKQSMDFYKVLLCNGWSPSEILDLVDSLTYRDPYLILNLIKNG